MMLVKKDDLITIREQIQEDAICILDGLVDDDVLDILCDMIAGHINNIIERRDNV